MKSGRRIGILTGGGDCPGLNAVIRAVCKTLINEYAMEIIGFQDGFQGMVENRYIELPYRAVSGILTQGGTILGTSNRADPFHFPMMEAGQVSYHDLSDQALKNCENLGLEACVCIGGDGTMTGAHNLAQKGLRVVGVPKTIDNDLWGTDQTFGYDSALTTAAEAIDKLHSTAQSHHRVMVVEVMGRYAGWLALGAGVAAGGDIILIPEIPYTLDSICAEVVRRNQRGARFSIVVVGEGAKAQGGKLVVQQIVAGSPEPVRLGGIGHQVGHEIEKLTGIETRVTVLGHLLRGGVPTPFDRLLATRFGVTAAQQITAQNYGALVVLKGSEISTVPIKDVAGKVRTIPEDSSLLKVARAVGTCLGD
ncbi:ATP-dependent 6-phosphofructokinase [candidate division KSB1 bacterium]|nr:ATP-dependent 6-phosphofructokinase [candidate division KSB1 bacterium]